MNGDVNYDSYFDPPAEKWGRCPRCGASQEDAIYLQGSDSYVCPCGDVYGDDEAHPTKDDLFEDRTGEEA
jgi:hypothetical protein